MQIRSGIPSNDDDDDDDDEDDDQGSACKENRHSDELQYQVFETLSGATSDGALQKKQIDKYFQALNTRNQGTVS